jgi:hypothetical protein
LIFMLKENSILSWLVASALCCLAHLPVRADDPVSVPPPTPVSAPVLDAPSPVLRPVPLPDGSTVTDASASNMPAAPLVASTDAPAPVSTPGTTTPTAPAPSPDAAAGQQVASDASANPPLPSAPPESLAPAPAAAPETPSQNVTINLINLMVKRGLITKDDASGLIKQAEQEAATARAQAAVASSAPASAQTAATPPSAPAAGSATQGDDDTVSVAYVPDVVRNQIRDEVKADVMKQAHDEHWASADPTPDWVHRFHVTGDIRTRYEGDIFPDGNATGEITNFNAINTGAPFDINTSSLKSGLIPTYNVDQNRDRFRLRARIGAGVDLGENFFAGMRVGTGSRTRRSAALPGRAVISANTSSGSTARSSSTKSPALSRTMSSPPALAVLIIRFSARV